MDLQHIVIRHLKQNKNTEQKIRCIKPSEEAVCMSHKMPVMLLND